VPLNLGNHWLTAEGETTVREGVAWFGWLGSPTVRIAQGDSAPALAPAPAPAAGEPAFEPVRENPAVLHEDVERLLSDRERPPGAGAAEAPLRAALGRVPVRRHDRLMPL